MTVPRAAAGKREVKTKKSQKSWRTWQRGTPWPPAVDRGGGGQKAGRAVLWMTETKPPSRQAGRGDRHTWQYLKTSFFKSPI